MASEVRVSPAVCTYPGVYNQLFIDIELPGVEKKDISLRISENSLSIEASREGVRFTGIYILSCPIDPKRAEAEYNNGLLSITVPYREPVEGEMEISIV